MLIDLQVHSNLGSPDSLLSPEEIVGECIESRIDGVALTEHNSCFHSPEIFNDAGLVLIPAREVALAGHHILVLSTDEQMLQSMDGSLTEQAEMFLRDDVACIWAHPGAVAGAGTYPTFRIDPSPVREVVSAIEILNGRHLHFSTEVEVALRLSLETMLPGTAGSDAHRPGDVGRCVTIVDSDRADGAAGVITAIRKGNVEPALNSVWAEKWGSDYRHDLRQYLR